MYALTRQPADLNGGERTYRDREPIDARLAREQHRHYEELLGRLGVRVLSLPALPELPDSVFVEDTALVLPEVAIPLPMGAASRLPEVESIAAALTSFRPLLPLNGPGTVDGGDVLRLGRRIYVGLSSRTNKTGIESLRQVLEPFGYTVHAVDVRGCLHLKSACTEAAPGLLLANPERVDVSIWQDIEILDVAPQEPDGCNVLRVGEVLVASTCFPRTLERLRVHGLQVHGLDNSEILKAEGALTCTSILFE